ncbi:MAG: hypothetical protein ACLTLQ_22105 [[Clostridium] scindens]
MDNKMKGRIKISIYAIALLMMGVIGITSALATIGANFPDASQTMIQNLISIPCFAIIPTTIIVGKLMETVPKKIIAVVGAACFLVGGIVPAFHHIVICPDLSNAGDSGCRRGHIPGCEHGSGSR